MIISFITIAESERIVNSQSEELFLLGHRRISSLVCPSTQPKVGPDVCSMTCQIEDDEEHAQVDLARFEVLDNGRPFDSATLDLFFLDDLLSDFLAVFATHSFFLGRFGSYIFFVLRLLILLGFALINTIENIFK